VRVAICDRKFVLIQALSSAASRHAKLTAVLGANAGNAKQVDFSAAKADCDNAASAYEIAKTSLDDHRGEHGC